MKEKFLPHQINHHNKKLNALSLESILKEVIQHKLVLIRGFDPLSREELLEYCQSQAKLLSWDFGPVMEMKVDEKPKNYLFTEGDVPLHWDGAFYQEPRFLFFHCLQAPAPGDGGETLFVNTQKVWESLEKNQKDEWQQHAFSFQTEKIVHYGGSITRQLLNKHPVTGEIILRFAEPVGENYLNPVSVSVIGKNPIESTQILKNISAVMRDPNDCYAHEWRTSDYLIADNFALLHGRNAFQKYSPRHLRRIQIL